MAPGSRLSREPGDKQPFHMTLLARNQAGYRNLLALATKAHLEGYYYRPRVDIDLLARGVGAQVEVGHHVDDLPVLGGLDDLVVVVLAVDLFLDGVPGEVLDEKLDELGIDRRAFGDDVARIRRFTPRPLRRLVRQVPGTIAVAGNALAHSGIGPRVRSWINKEGSIA